ncbi:hypothetical protein ACIGFL_03310 [Pseudomonas sp. NPDC077649]|uniref:hypothetical protein n=1 Tax=Pseudomonas sp. NPDC077649 TaxID=3364423 RepID=UPI0037CCA447
MHFRANSKKSYRFAVFLRAVSHSLHPIFQTNVYSFSIRAFVGFCDERQLFMDERLVCRDFASPFIHGAGIVYEAQ